MAGVLRIGSLCTGYGGLDLAARQVFGGGMAWVADPNPGPAAILSHRHPNVPNLGDLRLVHWVRVVRAHGLVDVVTAGYPCQPFSVAGDQKGINDHRHIWPHVATALRVFRPRLAVLENVANHLRLGFDTVLGDLAALGFDAEWCLVRASEVGAPHRRERLFVLAWPTDATRPGLPWRQLPGRPAERGGAAADAAHLGHDGSGDARGRRPGPADGRHSAAHPASERWGQGRTEPAGQQGGSGLVGRSGPATADADRDGCEGQQRGGPGMGARPDADRRGEECWGRYAPAIARWEAATGRPAPRATDLRGRLSPHFVEWMMGLPAGHVTAVPGLSRTAQLKALGNGVIPAQGAAALCYLADRAGLLPAGPPAVTGAAA